MRIGKCFTLSAMELSEALKTHKRYLSYADEFTRYIIDVRLPGLHMILQAVIAKTLQDNNEFLR